MHEEELDLVELFGGGARETHRGLQSDAKRCKRCGKGNLEWLHTGERWALANSKGLHRCSAPASADEFEDLS